MPSTVIRNFAYDPETEVLTVWFRPSGRRYDYIDVPVAVYDTLRASSTKGRYFNAHIRDRFDCVLVEGKAPMPPGSQAPREGGDIVDIRRLRRRSQRPGPISATIPKL